MEHAVSVAALGSRAASDLRAEHEACLAKISDSDCRHQASGELLAKVRVFDPMNSPPPIPRVHLIYFHSLYCSRSLILVRLIMVCPDYVRSHS